MAGLLTKDTTLSYKAGSGGTFAEIPLLMEVPELGGDPEKVEVTTLSDGVKKYIPGIRDLGDLAFKFLYDNSSDASNYRILRKLQEDNKAAVFKVEYPDGTGHQFDAYVNVKMDAASVNAIMTFTVSMSLQSDITVSNPTGP
ncbi:phage tail tube protein [Paenibacillus apiarius]|uniref:Phage tail protein n=1 Tax=Paenibacillus apiarius TaxID=46240 RepID=A0ABT4DQT3_9BACL|nr:phage tail tube protein [Paenibacillus apiarius]MCY9513315.1 phage tail protein [Paenibacillus apiarius]MCY9519713.1 phage tail protein [Paenibacillus apiarius]MCY9553231.1 phage tail protein [Paenibacillus apiarius]MCY9557081.1 phage tail protein [Paenibacillus apiarius]MCY9682178.1 phage tail protein [Paenibacillus apiarius]